MEFSKKYAELIALAILLLGLAYYLYDIDRWLAYDDEGGYLYAAWRIGKGEMPYRDFVTPKLPLFLYPGALLLKLSGNSFLALRATSALAVVLSAVFLYLTVRRVFDARTALLAMAVFMVHRDVYWSARFFRPEAYMLLYSAAGMFVFVCSYPNRRRGLAVSGLLFAMATLSRLFGFLPPAGCVLFMAYDAIRPYLRSSERRQAQPFSEDRPTDVRTCSSRVSATLPGAKIGSGVQLGGLAERTLRSQVRGAAERVFWFLAPYIALVSAAFALFYCLTPNLFAAILGHHLRQGSELSRLQVFLQGLRLYLDYFLGHPLLLLLTIPALVRSLRSKDSLQAVFACQIPTAATFLLLSRGLGGRHLVHLVPSLATLFAASLLSGSDPQKARRLRKGANSVIVLLLIALALWPSWRKNRLVAGWSENDTEPLAEYIQTHTGEDDYVLSDYLGLNFYARRKNTPLGTGLSRGATLGGQILGKDLIQEIEEKQVKMVLVNIAQGAHQLANLRDYDDFHRYVQDHFHLAGRVVYDYRLLEVYHLDELMPSPLDINFGDRIMLTGLAWGDGPMDLIDPSRSVGLHGIEAGGELVVTLRWRSLTHMEEDYYLVLRLIDEEGKLWGLGQRQLMDIETETYWDDKGLERAVQFPTSQWPVGEVVLDYYKLPVFPGTPPGRYQIIARLRPLDTWEGLEVLSQDVAPYGFDYPLGMLEVTRPSVPPAIAQLAIPHLFTEELGNEVQLLGYELAATEVKSGETLHLSFFWQALRQMDKDYYLLLQVRDAEGNVWAEEEFPLASKGYPTTRWVKDEMLRGQYDPLIDAEAPSGKYQLLLNLVDRASGNKVLSEDLVFAELAIAGRKRQFAVPKAIQYPMQANFGHCVTFLGYDLAETKIKPGRTLHLTLYWQAQMEMKTSYKVFTHILDREEQIWGQRDSIPVGGAYPTTGWLPGEVTIDEYEISVKPNAPAGEYRIEVGMYDAVTGKRLPVFDEEGKRIPQDRVLLNSRVRVAR